MVAALATLAASDARSLAAPGRPFRPGDKIRYAAKTEVGSGHGQNGDYFNIIEDEQLFLVANAPKPMRGDPSKRASEAFAEFYQRPRDLDATWPYPLDTRLSDIENRLVGGLRWTNAKLHDNQQRAGAVAAVVTTGVAYIAHVGVDRAYLVRDGQIRQLTQDHTLLGEYRRDHPDASPDELARVPRKTVVTRALGRRPSVDVVIKTDLRVGDRIVLCSPGVQLAIHDASVLRIFASHGLAKSDLDATVAALIEHAQRSGPADTTVVVIGFVAKAG